MAKKIFATITFLLLFFSFYMNLWNIAPKGRYEQFEPYGEAHVLGKLARAEKEGIFHHAGFLGINYEKSLYNTDFEDNKKNIEYRNHFDINYDMCLEQRDYYLGTKDIPNGYYAYLSLNGGQGIFYSALDKILPFNNSVNYQIFRIINCAILSLCFVLLLCWVFRNYGKIAAAITFILLFLSQWIILFCGNGLWWALWNFYLPFLATLLLLEKKYNSPNTISNLKIYLIIAVTIFIKCFFSGFEFITTTLCTIFCPIIYYSYLNKDKFRTFFLFCIKAGIAAITGLLIYIIIYTTQLYVLFGNTGDIMDYLRDSFVRRAESPNSNLLESLIYIVLTYLGGESFNWGFLDFGFKFRFIYICFIITVFAGIVYYLSMKIKDRKYKALLITAVFSTVCPFSWYFIFREHAIWHVHLDYIVWYMPTLLLGFTIVGTGISLIYSRIRSK